MQPDNFTKTPKARGNIRTPLLANAGLLLVAALLVSLITRDESTRQSASALFGVTVGLLLLNVGAMIVVGIMGKFKTALGLLLSILLIALIGFGACVTSI